MQPQAENSSQTGALAHIRSSTHRIGRTVDLIGVLYDFAMGYPRQPPLRILFWVVLADYLAQIPYYLINYYFPSQLPPAISAVVLLGLTLVWFLVGYFALRRRKSWGFWVLLSFLAVEALFYAVALVSGVAAFQLENHNLVIKAVFIVGYITGAVSAIFVILIIHKRRLLVGPGGESRQTVRKNQVQTTRNSDQ
jgi:hypothetical protein